MEVTLPLREMTTADKIKTMETLWADLCKNTDDISSPGWHEDILKGREAGLRQGSENIIEWSEAKKKIIKSIDKPAE